MIQIRLIQQSPRSRAITALALMSCLCLVLTCARVYLSHNYTYLFLVWNLLLAWIPLCCADLCYASYFKSRKNMTVLFLSGFFWMIFFPNAPYIITDFIHLEGRHMIPIWFDALMIFSFALTGLLTGYLSMYFIHTILEHRYNRTIGWIAVCFMMLISAYGIFLGRVLRFNSWDIFGKPLTLIHDCIRTAGNMQALKMTFIFFLFLTFSYYILHSIIYINHNNRENYDR